MEVAAKVGTSLALSALPPLLNKLSSKFGGDVTEEEMKHLDDFVRYEIVALTREANSDDLVRSTPLLEKLQAAALELEDLLDLYDYNQLKKQVSSSSSNPIKKFIPIFKEKLGPVLLKSPLRIGFENLLKFVEQVEKIHPFITSRTATTQAQANIITPTTSTLSSPYFGRDNQCDSIIEFLLDESYADSSRRRNEIPVISIIGMGGSGKSHTVQRVCDDDRIKNHFGAIMWVHVTRDFDVVALTRKMVESATNEICPNFDNFDVLQKKLKESLSNKKKFLLVLDDVWCEDKIKWDELVGPLNEFAQNGSKIIMTTRIKNIAHILHAKEFYLEELKTEECWSILKHYAFNNCEKIIDDQELLSIGNQIISKVKHSPLAVKVVGSSLSTKKGVTEWEKILKQDTLKETMDLLLFSYQCLPPHLQRCFAYCSLFPKGYKFNIDIHARRPHLISLWIAQGFIERTSELTFEEVGRKYIDQLLSYSFLEKKSDDSVGDHFIIHDLLHDLAEKVSMNQCHRIEHHDSLHVPKTCVHLSLCLTKNLVSVGLSTILAVFDKFKLRYLRSLIVLHHGGYISIFEGKKNIFENITKLRALYVEDYIMTVLIVSRIGKLKHLRYLHVRYDSKLPASWVKLYQLQFFILITVRRDSDAHLFADTLPQDFNNLTNLRTLQFYDKIFYDELDYLYYNSKMINIGKLKSLQNLKKFHVDASNEMILLRDLALGGSLSILNLENVKCKEEAEEAMLNRKQSIDELIFVWSHTTCSIRTCEKVLEGLEPHQNLERLEINGYQSAKFPKWTVKENWLPRLWSLRLEFCASLKIVPSLPPRLQKLFVMDCDELIQLPPLSGTLLELMLLRCPKLQALTNLSPTLTLLDLEDCPNLTVASTFNKSPSLCDLSFLTSLEMLSLSGLSNFKALNLSPALIYLRIGNCPKLTRLGNLQRCTSLKELTISKCPMVRREEASLVEGVVDVDIANRLPQLEHIDTDEPLLVFELIQQQAFSSITNLTLRDRAGAALPNLEQFSSLKGLYIDRCPDVELLPNLSVSLRSLWIHGCPKLKEKYEEGAPLRNTVSHISHICIS